AVASRRKGSLSRRHRARAGECAARVHRTSAGREHRQANHPGQRRSDAKGEAMSEVLLERPEDAIAVVRLNRPEVRNALNGVVRGLLAEHVRVVGRAEAPRCIIATGGEKVFAGGADIRDMVDRTPMEMMARHAEKLWDPIASCPKPVIAAVNGYALGGGCELAMPADIIVAGEGASYGQPEVRIGSMPGAGGAQRRTG